MKGLNDLKEIFKDRSLHIYVGQVAQLFLAQDRSFLKVKVKVYPEERHIIATMSWENVGSDSGDFEFPAIGDMVLVANSEGDDDQAYIIRRLTSKEDKIPAIAATGKVQSARNGNKFWNISDTRINLSRGQAEPAENIVLGQVFKSFMTELLAELKTMATTLAQHTHVGNMGSPTSPPEQAGDFSANGAKYDGLKASPIGNEAILSSLSFTEK
jgi:hypothetical protein